MGVVVVCLLNVLVVWRCATAGWRGLRVFIQYHLNSIPTNVLGPKYVLLSLSFNNIKLVVAQLTGTSIRLVSSWTTFGLAAVGVGSAFFSIITRWMKGRTVLRIAFLRRELPQAVA